MDQHTAGQHSVPSQPTSSFQWLSLAHQGLTEIPYDSILTQTNTLEVLDLSYNFLDEYPFFRSGSVKTKQLQSIRSTSVPFLFFSFIHSFFFKNFLPSFPCQQS